MRHRHSGQRVWDASQLEAWERVGLVGHWVGTGSGLTLPDRSGYGRHGTLVNGPLWTIGREGIRNALDFDGAGDHVTLPAGPCAGATAWTVCAWIWMRSLVNTASPFFGDLGLGSQPSLRFITADAKFHGYAHTGGGWIVNNLATNATFEAQRWYHLAFVHNGTAATIYVDGRADASVGATGTVGSAAGRIGGFGNSSAGWFPGIIDDARAYTRGLSPAEIARLADPSRRITATGRRRVRLATAGGGTLKTWNTLTSANLKTWNGVARASLKTWNGLT